MLKNWRAALVVSAGVALAGLPAMAAGFFTNGVPPAGGTQYPTTIPLTGIEAIPADTGLASGANPASESITVSQLAGYAGALPSKANVLIGGDATTNLWQRATSGSSVTTTVTYGGPDRWAYWSGTGTAMTVVRDSTAADLPANSYQYGFKVARTSGQTGVIQVCFAQAIESSNSYQMAGQTVELDFHARAGANFSAANSNLVAYVIYGTGADEGMSKMAWGLNAGGGGSTAWTGQTNATAAVIPISTTVGRYAAVATVPATATEVGVAICWTPVGTAGTNDYVALSGIQLVRNGANAGLVSATAGYNCASQQCASFDRTRLAPTEAQLQYRYYYRLLEGAPVTVRAVCSMSTTSIANCLVPFPTVMRAAPTMAYVTGFAASASVASSSVTACTGLTTSATLTSSAASTTGVLMDCASSAGFGAAGTSGFLWDNATATPGQVNASAEL